MKSIGLELERLKVIVNNTDNKKPSSCWGGRISEHENTISDWGGGVVSRDIDLEGLATRIYGHEIGHKY